MPDCFHNSLDGVMAVPNFDAQPIVDEMNARTRAPVHQRERLVRVECIGSGHDGEPIEMISFGQDVAKRPCSARRFPINRSVGGGAARSLDSHLWNERKIPVPLLPARCTR
jgi:hypothetical protein